ncbi:CPBP family intramembrane glutamic endopeptidase [Enterococcus olivae]
MSIKKYSLLTIGIYAVAYYLPSIATDLDGQVILTTITYLLGAACLTGLYLKQKKKLSFETTQFSWILCLLLGFLGIFAAIYLQNIVLYIEQFLGQDITSANTSGAIQIILQQPLFMTAVMIGGPIMEEFVFRRALVGLMESSINVWLAIGISSVLFALIHQDGHLLLYFSLGFFFSSLYYLTGRIWTPILAHVGMNSLVVIVQLFYPF